MRSVKLMMVALAALTIEAGEAKEMKMTALMAEAVEAAETKETVEAAETKEAVETVEAAETKETGETGEAAGRAAVRPVRSERKVRFGELESFVIYSPEMGREVTVEVLLPEGFDRGTTVPEGNNKKLLSEGAKGELHPKGTNEKGELHPKGTNEKGELHPEGVNEKGGLRGVAGRYPVVYMHDGQNLVDAESNWNKQAWEMDAAVESLEGVKPIVVGIFSVPETRVGDLMPTEPLEGICPQVRERYLSVFPGLEVKGDRYVDFIANTLKPEIDRLYPTLPDVENTSVMGSSMGGLASLYALCRRPDVFGAAGCLSTHFIGSYMPNEVFPTAFAAYLLGNLPIDDVHRIYFDTGDRTMDANYGPYFDRIMKMITEMGATEGQFMYRKFPGAAHEESSWAERVGIPLRFLLRE